jgi:hypothetical protein
MAWWHRKRKRVRVSNLQAQNGPSEYHESGDVKTLTQGTTYRAGGLGFDEIVGMAGGASKLEAAAAGPVSDRSLHATGQTCPRCGRAFTADDPVRRDPSAGLVHDVC